MLLRIQYTRHLHDKVKTIDERTTPKVVDNSAAEAAAAAAMGGGMLGLGGNLMIADAGYGGESQCISIYLPLLT
jgi:hypothetical protein